MTPVSGIEDERERVGDAKPDGSPSRKTAEVADSGKPGRFSHRRDRKIEGAEGDAEPSAQTDDLPDLEKIDDPIELRETASWLREELIATRIDRTEHLDHLLRIKAEFDNYRKRMLREQSDVVARAAQSMVESLLQVLDSFDFAMEHPPDDLPPDDPFLKGVMAVRNQLLDILDKEGLERIEPAPGVDFDPNVHEAVAHVPGDGDAEKIAEVVQPGYRFKGRLLRAAKVAVGG